MLIEWLPLFDSVLDHLFSPPKSISVLQDTTIRGILFAPVIIFFNVLSFLQQK